MAGAGAAAVPNRRRQRRAERRRRRLASRARQRGSERGSPGAVFEGASNAPGEASAGRRGCAMGRRSRDGRGEGRDSAMLIRRRAGGGQRASRRCRAHETRRGRGERAAERRTRGRGDGGVVSSNAPHPRADSPRRVSGRRTWRRARASSPRMRNARSRMRPAPPSDEGRARSSRRGRPARVDVALGRARLAAGGFANDDAGVRARAVVCALRGRRAEQRRWGVKSRWWDQTVHFFILSRLGYLLLRERTESEDWCTCISKRMYRPSTRRNSARYIRVFRTNVRPTADNLKWEDFSRTRNARSSAGI